MHNDLETVLAHFIKVAAKVTNVTKSENQLRVRVCMPSQGVYDVTIDRDKDGGLAVSVNGLEAYYPSAAEYIRRNRGLTEPRKVIAANSLGRDKEMDLEEYTRRAVTDHRCMAFDEASMAEAQALYDQQKAFAEKCFNALYARQNA